jgi:hypothetical protein
MCSPKLAPFIEYLTSLTTVIEERHDGRASSEDTMGLARQVKSLLVDVNEYNQANSLLVDVNEYDQAQHLSKLFQLKEAL